MRHAPPELYGETSRHRGRSGDDGEIDQELSALAASSARKAATGREKGKMPNEVLLAVGLVTNALQGGGLIFGFSAFADKVIKLPKSPFSTDSVANIFAIGHNITAWGCIISGLLLDKFGPRVTAASGLLIEAVGHAIMLHLYDVPTWMVHVGYGMLGIGGCQVLLAALTFADAFQNAALTNSLITSAFQVGGFIFMILPYMDWAVFFKLYVGFCIAGAAVTGLLYPDATLPTYSQGRDGDATAEAASVTASGATLTSVLLRPGTLWFLATFCVAGSAFCYGYGEFVVALKDKDACNLNDRKEEVCASKALQDTLNNVLMPIVGNFILPCAFVLGRIIDKMGFAPVAFINVFFVQVFILCLWLLPLHAQYVTLFVYNVANTAVFTVQNAYICAVGHSHIGALFGIANFALGAGNLLADYLTLNPFGSAEDKVHTSLVVSCIAWLCLTTPLYFWVIVEMRQARNDNRTLKRVSDAVPHLAVNDEEMISMLGHSEVDGSDSEPLAL
mmetsp:Transcript_153981/g.295240  ORF Transcript_153981/g.295240 Transcript_153981/m.295240 type:complete len:504 (-) Transcript_153981:61-1572(-)